MAENVHGNIGERLEQAMTPTATCTEQNALAANSALEIGSRLMDISAQISVLGSEAVALVRTTYPQNVIPPTERASEALQRTHDGVATVLEGAQHPYVESGLAHLEEAITASRDITQNVRFASEAGAQELEAATKTFIKAIRKTALQDLITPFLGGDQLEGAMASFLGEAPQQGYQTHTNISEPVEAAGLDLSRYLGEIL